jgi:hypothetical protein
MMQYRSQLREEVLARGEKLQRKDFGVHAKLASEKWNAMSKEEQSECSKQYQEGRKA